MSEMTKCIVCGNDIHLGAKKCTHCGSYQDFRRYMTFSSTVLGLLVALISVTTFAIPVWEKLFWKPEVSVSAKLLEVDNKGFASISVSNAGNVPFGVESITTGSTNNALRFNLDGVDPSSRIVQPNSIAAYKVPLSVDIDEFSTNVEELVLIFQAAIRRNEFCRMQIDVVTTEGLFDHPYVDARTRGFDAQEEEHCPARLKKLYTVTIDRLGQDEAYVREICKVTARHPMDPDNPKIGTACLKYEDESEG